MVAILEKGEFNSDFHPMVDFIAASPLRYALTVKPAIFVSHIRQFWSTARIETKDEETHILATVDGIQRTVSESSLRRNLKLKDEGGIVSIPDTEIFKNLTLMGPKSTGFNEFSSNIAIALVCLATNRTYNFSKMIFDGMVKNVNNKISKFLMYPSPSFSGRIVPLFDTMLVHQGEGLGTPTEPHHTPFPEADTSHTTTSSIPLLSLPTAPIPLVTLPDPTPIRQYTRRARIAQSSALPTVANEPASPIRDVSEGEAYPTESGFIADQDRATIAKSSTLPHNSAPRVTSPVLMRADREGVATKQSGDDAPIKGRSINEGEAAAKRISNDSEDVARVLTSMDAATILAGRIDVPTGSGSIPTAGPPTTIISTGSEVGPTASPIVTPYSRRKGKEIARDAEVARIHAEEEIQGMIDSLDRSNETTAKYLQEYQEFALELPLEKRIELISDLVKYQEHYSKVHKFQSQQRRPMTKKQKREYYMAMIKNNLGWKEHVKKQKTSEEAPEMEKPTEEITEEKMKELMQLVPVKDVYVQALHVKHPIIDWKVHTEGQRSYWKIIRLGGSSACYQFFVDLLKQLDMEDLNQLWALVKEYLSIRLATSEKEMELWVELKRMYELDPEDQPWTVTHNFMHAHVEWKLYDLSGVHHLTAKDKEIFML
nr:xylulose kinase-1 [Tanacetum cinerariifolium]